MPTETAMTDIGPMVALIASLTIFLREIFLSIDSPRAPVI